MMRRTVAFLVGFIGGVLSAEPKAYRRCISKFVEDYSAVTSNHTLPLLKTLQEETVCEGSFVACSKLSQNSIDATPIEPPYLLAILLLPDSRDDEFLALAGSLLIQGFQITVYDFLRPGSDYRVDYIQNKVLTQIPCKPDAKLKSSLNVISAIDAAGKCTRKPLDRHMIKRAYQMMDLLVMTMGYDPTVPSDHPDTKFRADVLIMDVYNVAGLLMADKFQIPAITIGPASSLELAIDHHAEWEPPVTWDHWSEGIYLILRQRWQSLMLTKPLMALNSKRRKVGLGPLKRPSDYFLPVVGLIIQFLPDEYIEKARHQDYWNIIHSYGAIQPLCIPCVSSYKQVTGWRQTQTNPTIMVSLPPDYSTLETTSTVLQSIILSQQILIRRKRLPFAIVWLDFGDESVSFSAADDDFTRESSVSLVDSLSRHPNTVMVIGHCDSDFMVASMLGVSVFCVSQDEEMSGLLPLLFNETGMMDPNEIPKLLVQDYLQNHAQTETNDDLDHGMNESGSRQRKLLQLDGLSQATSLIKKVAETHRRSLPWNSTEEMHNTIAAELKDEKSLWRVHEQRHYDAIGTLWAWFVVLATCCYIFVKSFSSPPIEGYIGKCVDRFDDFFPDIEDSLRMMENWYLQQATGESEGRLRIAMRRRNEKDKKV
mmetsp:Transcript_11869/g.28423  ORF Transcript_11869/g.28423 Transcript_11869/m.28423 type:complete len:652 (+) Transcript_11869:195-2150(+)